MFTWRRGLESQHRLDLGGQTQAHRLFTDTAARGRCPSSSWYCPCLLPLCDRVLSATETPGLRRAWTRSCLALLTETSSTPGRRDTSSFSWPHSQHTSCVDLHVHSHEYIKHRKTENLKTWAGPFIAKQPKSMISTKMYITSQSARWVVEFCLACISRINLSRSESG